MIENAQLIGLSRQMALQRQMDVVANNLANINSTGFKAEAILFEEYVMPVASDRSFPSGSQQLSYVQDWATMHDLAAGSMTQTGNPLDVALSGEGFLTVQAPEGTRYTRNGALEINSDGVLVTQNGFPVLSDGGNQIVFGADETGIAITADHVCRRHPAGGFDHPRGAGRARALQRLGRGRNDRNDPGDASLFLARRPHEQARRTAPQRHPAPWRHASVSSQQG